MHFHFLHSSPNHSIFLAFLLFYKVRYRYLTLIFLYAEEVQGLLKFSATAYPGE